MRLTKIVTFIILTVVVIDCYNLFFRFRYDFDIEDFDKTVEIFANTKLPLRSTISISGDFECPVYFRHGTRLSEKSYTYEFVGKVDSVIYTEYYGGPYSLEFENKECVKHIDKLQLRVSNLDFTVLRLMMN